MITLVGIGHVFSIRDAVKYIIFTRKPDVVCIELDKLRFDALEKGLRGSDKAPFIFKRLQKIYDKAAETQGAQVGEEMMGAVEAAKTLEIPHRFIDVEASPIVTDMFKDLTLTQKLKLFGTVLGASVIPKKHLEEGIKKIEESPEEFMDQFEKAFPNLKRDIVDYRDRYMASRLLEISQDYGHPIAIVGEGHIPGISGYLKHQELEIIRLKDVKDIARRINEGEIKLPNISENTKRSENTFVSFSFDTET